MTDAVVGNLVVAAALAGPAVVVGRCGLRPAVAHALWLLVLVKLVTPPVFTVPVPVLPAAAVVPVEMPAVEVEEPALVPVPVAAALRPVMAKPSPVVVVPEAVAVPWRSIVLAVWAAGSLAYLAVVVVRVRRFARWLAFAEVTAGWVREVEAVAARVGLRTLPRVRTLPGAVSPFVWAVGRPTLYLPAELFANLPADRRAALVAHELAHLKRRDHFVRFLELFALAAYWWCPLAWLARRELRRAEEDCCDAWVTHALPGAGPAYAAALLDTADFLADAPPAPAMATGMGAAADLRRRLVAVLGPPRRPGLSHFGRAVVLAGFVALPVVPAAARVAGAAVVPVVKQDRPTPAAEVVQFAGPSEAVAVPGPVTAAATSSDGRFLAVAHGDAVTILNARTRDILRTLRATSRVTAVAFSPGGLVAAASEDGFVRTWDADTGSPRGAVLAHASWATAVAFSPDGHLLASGGYDRVVRIRDAASLAPVCELAGHTAGVRAVAFAPDSRTVASAGADGTVRMGDAVSGTGRVAFAGVGVRCLAFGPAGKLLLAAGTDDGHVKFWDAAAGRDHAPPAAAGDGVTAVAFSAGGRVLLAGTAGGGVANLNPVTGRLRGFLGTASTDAVAGVGFANGTAIAVGHDGGIRTWEPAAPAATPAGFPGTRSPATCVATDGYLVAAGELDGTIRVWDAATGTAVRTLVGHRGAVTGVAFAGGKIVSAGADETVRVWEISTGKVLRTMVQSNPVARVAAAADGRTVAVAVAGLNAVGVWDVDTGRLVRKMTAPAAVTAIGFSPDGQTLAVGTAAGDVSFRDAATGDERHRGAAAGRVDRIAFAPDGKTAVVAVNGPAPAVVVWDVADGTPRDGPGVWPTSPVGDAAYADAKTIVTAGHDGAVTWFDVATGRPVRTAAGHADAAAAVAVGRAGVFTAGDDHAVRPWAAGPPGGTP